jgi:hypothetical protein
MAISHLLIPTFLFILLSPGMLITLPPQDNGLFLSNKTSRISVIVHAVIFILLLWIIHIITTKN